MAFQDVLLGDVLALPRNHSGQRGAKLRRPADDRRRRLNSDAKGLPAWLGGANELVLLSEIRWSSRDMRGGAPVRQ